MTPRQRLFINGLMRSTISQPVLAISIRDRDVRLGCPFDMLALTAPMLQPATS